jgi:hypothetical protein
MFLVLKLCEKEVTFRLAQSLKKSPTFTTVRRKVLNKKILFQTTQKVFDSNYYKISCHAG